MIKVGIETKSLVSGHSVRGIGVYTKNLLEAFNESKINNLKIEEFRKENSYDIIHYPYFDLFFLTLPLRKPIKTVVTIHDVIPLVFPEYYPAGIRGRIKFLIQKFSLKGVSVVITDSQNSKKDIVKYLDYPEEKIHIVYLAPGKSFRKLEAGNWELETRKKYNLPGNFIFYVGDVNYNKNIPGLIKAFAEVEKTTVGPPVKLVLAGKAFTEESLSEARQIVQLIKDFKLDGKLVRLGWVSEEELVKIYNLAAVYCQPSFYEGFGLPVLEAMACGCPVVAAKTSSLPEICGDGALMIDSNDYNEIAGGIKRVVEDQKLREDLIKKGFLQVRKFSWQKTAQETIDVYQKLV